jgi:hypothetical protein
MGKMRLFEIHDQAWFPGFLRDQTTDALQFILNTGNLYGPIVHHLSGALTETGTVRILDLCSGAGGPWLKLSKVFEQKEGLPLHISLTDRYPNVRAFDNAKSPGGNGIHFHAIPVDATQIPDELNGFRTIFSSFHHFKPREARAILQDAVNKQRGIGIFEVAGRRAVTVLLTFLMPIGSLILTPFMRPFRWARFLWTYIIPVIPFVLWFDAIMSCLRAYSLQELVELTSGLAVHGYEWKIGQESNGLFPVPITYLIGYPIRASQETSGVRG